MLRLYLPHSQRMDAQVHLHVVSRLGPAQFACHTYLNLTQNFLARKIAKYEFRYQITDPQHPLRQERKRRDGEIRSVNWTNLWNQGLISADRNNKATLLLTIPSFIFKSSARDLSSPIFKSIIQNCSQPTFPLTDHKSSDMYHRPKPYCYTNLTWRSI